MKTRLLILTLLTIVGHGVYSQGTIQFQNNAALHPVRLERPNGPPVPPGTPLYFAVFWGTTETTVSDVPVLPLGTMSTVTGLMTAPQDTFYPLPGTQPNQRVYLRFRGWSSSFGSDWQAAQAAWVAGQAFFGETDIRLSDPLGATLGPGVPIWQGVSGTSPNRFHPLVIFVPEPSTLLLGALGVGCLLLLKSRRPSR